MHTTPSAWNESQPICSSILSSKTMSIFIEIRSAVLATNSKNIQLNFHIYDMIKINICFYYRRAGNHTLYSILWTQRGPNLWNVDYKCKLIHVYDISDKLCLHDLTALRFKFCHIINICLDSLVKLFV